MIWYDMVQKPIARWINSRRRSATSWSARWYRSYGDGPNGDNGDGCYGDSGDSIIENLMLSSMNQFKETLGHIRSRFLLPPPVIFGNKKKPFQVCRSKLGHCLGCSGPCCSQPCPFRLLILPSIIILRHIRIVEQSLCNLLLLLSFSWWYCIHLVQVKI